MVQMLPILLRFARKTGYIFGEIMDDNDGFRLKLMFTGI